MRRSGRSRRALDPGDRPGDLSRRQFLRAGGAVVLAPAVPRLPSLRARPRGRASIVLDFNDAILRAVRTSGMGPPAVARALAIAHTCMYDAWAAYDARAIGTRVGAALRRPRGERTRANVERAIAFAAHRAAADLFASSAPAFDALMRSRGYDPRDRSTDPSKPAAIGNLAARAVLDARHRDGANQLGDEPGGPPGVPYADYTGYAAKNAPMDLRAAFDRASVRDPSAWQPLRYLDAGGRLVTPGFVGAQWRHVTPFAVAPASMRSSAGPARYGSARYLAQARALLRISAGLTDRLKAIAEYWADGFGTELPPGHWCRLAEAVARRDHAHHGALGLARDVRLFFALSNALHDAACCAWDSKREFDSVRPVTALRVLFQGRQVWAWAGPYRGKRVIDGGSWLPYQPATFPTPPFPEYCSGHSAFSAAAAEVLRRFTGHDRFGGRADVPAGTSQVEPGVVPANDLTLSWATFSDAADEAGLSRRYGGIHFAAGDLEGRRLGQLAGRAAWRTAEDHWRGQ